MPPAHGTSLCTAIPGSAHANTTAIECCSSLPYPEARRPRPAHRVQDSSAQQTQPPPAKPQLHTPTHPAGYIATNTRPPTPETIDTQMGPSNAPASGLAEATRGLGFAAKPRRRAAKPRLHTPTHPAGYIATNTRPHTPETIDTQMGPSNAPASGLAEAARARGFNCSGTPSHCQGVPLEQFLLLKFGSIARTCFNSHTHEYYTNGRQGT